jgi:hypothetical protein
MLGPPQYAVKLGVKVHPNLPLNSYIDVERRYARRHGCDLATLAFGRGTHLHADWSFSPPPPPMTIEPPTIGNHVMIDVWQSC